MIATKNTNKPSLPMQGLRNPNFKLIEKIAGDRIPILLVSLPTEKKHYIMKLFPYKDCQIDATYTNEVRFTSLSHKHVIKFLRTQDKQVNTQKGKSFYSSYIVMERAPFGDFASLFEKTKIFEDEKILRSYFHQLIEGIEYLHQNGVYHFDIKPDNLLLGEDLRLKITDFDRSFKRGDSAVLGKGTRNYRPPELINPKGKDLSKVDVFGAGITLFVLKYGYFPYLEENSVEGYDLYEMMLNEDPEFWAAHQKLNPSNSYFEDSFKELLTAMVKADSSERASLAEVKKSAWYNGPVYSEKELQAKVSQYLLNKNK